MKIVFLGFKKKINSESNTHGYGQFIYSDLWKKKSKKFVDEGKLALPFFLYIDDCEMNNPLGSQADPLTMVYYSFPFLEKTQISLASVIKSKDYKAYGNFKSLRHLIAEISKLETDGIIIKTHSGDQQVHFILGLILGDNLGLNTVLGFSAFGANYFCRFCKDIKLMTHKCYGEDSSTLRNVENYKMDVATNNFSITGVKEECVFNSIESFHVTTNFCVDVMHDIFEGICHYDLAHVLTYFIKTRKYFDLKTLNVRKQTFNYSELEIGNNSREITESHIVKSHFNMSAREMMTFTHFLPLMIGDLVPIHDEVWGFLLNFIEIIDILLSFNISDDDVDRLQVLIFNHHKDYVRLFKDTLKPKHHHLVHYRSVIKMSGAPRNYWSFQYESYHKEFKKYAQSITSRINLCYSIARKFQLQFAYMLTQPIPSLIALQECHQIIASVHIDLIRSFAKE